MSHAIFFHRDLDEGASLEQVKGCSADKAVYLSNITFADMWEAMEFDKRKFIANDGSGQRMETLWHTTIWDHEPVGMSSALLLAALDDTVFQSRYKGAQRQLEELALAAAETDAYIWVF